MANLGDGDASSGTEDGLTREELLHRALLGGAALIGSGAVLAGCGSSNNPNTTPNGKPRRGGTFRIGVSGGGSNDFIDGQNLYATPDIARLVATFEGLSRFDEDYRPVVDGLAEEITAEKADQWLIRIRDGIEFHNGKTLTADDVIYSIRRTLDPDLGLVGRAGLEAVDPNRITKLDERTVRLVLARPDATLLDAFSQYFQGIVPEGYSPKSPFGKGRFGHIGTGPFKVKSFDPGRQSVHVRNENYWRTGQPYFDEVVIIDFPDDAARLNALLSRQVHAITGVPLAQVPVVEKRSGLKLYTAPTGTWGPLFMNVKQAPFTDERVRLAFKLLANREQMVSQALAGHGEVGNDVFGRFDPSYAGGDFPQREPDPEQARSLLKAAGHEGLTIDLNVTPGESVVEGAQVFAENAKAAGVTVNVKNLDSATFYNDQYLKRPFGGAWWGTRNYLAQVGVTNLPSSPYNETNWSVPEYTAMYKEALATLDLDKRSEIIKAMQQLDYEKGGYIVGWFKNVLNAYSAEVRGFEIDRGSIDLNKFGNGFRTIYFV